MDGVPEIYIKSKKGTAMKKRIGNDIAFTWTVNRKNGELLVPESFEGKECMVRLIDDWGNAAVIDDVTFSTGQVTWLFKGKNQKRCSTFTAVLYENQGEDEMVTVDKVKAVTLVAHSYMEDDEECPCGTVEVESVEIESEITAGGSTPIDAYTKAETDALLAEKVNTEYPGERFRAKYSDKVVEFLDLDLLGTSYAASYSAYGINLYYNSDTGHIRYDGKLKVNDEAVAMASDLAGKQDTINDLANIRSGAQAGATAYQKPGTGIPATDLASDVQTDLAAIDGIEAVIPEQASASNKLADKNFVNSSIATATATYRGSYNLVSDLSLTVSATQQQIVDALATKMAALSITPDNNDYCFVQIPTADATPTEIARIDRYKYNGTAWAYEYSLNNSSFTAAQWAALNSGITSGLVAKLSDLPTATELATLLAGKASTQELAGKEDITPIEAVASGTTAITAQVNKYYEVAGEVGTLAITLPTPTDLTKVSMVVVHLTAGTTPNVVIGSEATIDYSAAYDISANKEYEINCLFNGDKWIVADMEVV